MNIETKFNLGELVVPIRQRSESISEPCPECEGTGSVALLKGGAAPCQSRECRWGKINARVIHGLDFYDAETLSEIAAPALIPIRCGYSTAGLPSSDGERE